MEWEPAVGEEVVSIVSENGRIPKGSVGCITRINSTGSYRVHWYVGPDGTPLNRWSTHCKGNKSHPVQIGKQVRRMRPDELRILKALEAAAEEHR